MKTIKNIFFAVAIILFATGMWPIAIPSTIIYLILTALNGKKQKEENQELKAENQKLRQELQEQAVRRAMDKAEGREKE